MPQPTAAAVKRELKTLVRPKKAAFYPRFFKTGKNEYGEGDRFLGVVVPDQRRVATKFQQLPRSEVSKLLADSYHECRLTGILILVKQFEKAKTEAERKEIYQYYLNHLQGVNNWDLVDSSAHKIIGRYLSDKSDRRILDQLARSKVLWHQRIAIIATYWFIKSGDFDDTIRLSEKLLNHPHDLMHKAIGWMLREMGKQDETVLLAFLDKHYMKMPRTMLRYSLEKLSPGQKSKYMSK